MCNRMQQAPTYIRELFTVTELVRSMWSQMPFVDNFMMLRKTATTTLIYCSSSHPNTIVNFRVTKIHSVRLFFCGRLVIPTEHIRQKLLSEFHSYPVVGHSGIQAIMAQIAACFYWPGLPQSFDHSVIWVTCDQLTKSVHFIGLPSHFQAQDLTR